MARNKQKYYVVWKGFQPGIYNSWEACKSQIEGFPQAQYKSFVSKEIAEKAIVEGPEKFIGFDERQLSFLETDLKNVGRPILESLAVDAACSGNPGVLEYQGVHAGTGRVIFRMGPYPEGTVNLGEFLALVHGLAHLKKKGSIVPVYSDSKTAISWVKKKKVNTKLERKPINENLFQLVDRALIWLHNNSYPNLILKWETKFWGEIPADFGRK